MNDNDNLHDDGLLRETGRSRTATLQEVMSVGGAAARRWEEPRLAEPLRRDASAAEMVRHAARHAHTTLFQQRVGALWDADRNLIVYYNNHHNETQNDVITSTIAVLTTSDPELTVVADASFPERGEPDAGYTIAIALSGAGPDRVAHVREVAEAKLEGEIRQAMRLPKA